MVMVRPVFGIQGLATDVRRPIRRVVAGALVASLLAPCVAERGVRADVLDRLVAVVGSRPILESDVRLAGSLGLVEAPAGQDEAAIIEQLINRALMLDEVDRFGPGEPDMAAVAARLEALRARVGAEAMAQVLARAGVPEPALVGWLRDEIRIEQYLAQRFNAVAQPTGDEVSRYYEEHPEEFTRAGVLQPLADVEVEIQQALAASRRAELIAEWQQSLRRRARVRILPPADGTTRDPEALPQLDDDERWPDRATARSHARQLEF